MPNKDLKLKKKFKKHTKGQKSQTIKEIVKEELKKEVEYKQVSSPEVLNGSADGTEIANGTWTLYTPTVATYDLCYIAEGSDDRNRIGNSVKVRTMHVAGVISFPAYTGDALNTIDIGTQMVRVVVAQLKENTTPAAIAAYLQAGPLFNNVEFSINDNIANNENFKALAYVLHDKVITRRITSAGAIASAGTPATAYGFIPSDAQIVKFNIKPKTLLKWKVGTSSLVPDMRGNIIMLFYYARVRFTGMEVAADPEYFDFGRQVNYMDL